MQSNLLKSKRNFFATHSKVFNSADAFIDICSSVRAILLFSAMARLRSCAVGTIRLTNEPVTSDLF